MYTVLVDNVYCSSVHTRVTGRGRSGRSVTLYGGESTLYPSETHQDGEPDYTESLAPADVATIT